MLLHSCLRGGGEEEEEERFVKIPKNVSVEQSQNFCVSCMGVGGEKQSIHEYII